MPSFGPPRNHIPGRDYSSCIKGAVLTDFVIDRYILSGHYGAERQRAALARSKKRKREPRSPKPKSLALDFLSRHAR